MIARKNPLVRLEHIRDEIVAITGVLQGVSRHKFLDDYLLRRGAERALLCGHALGDPDRRPACVGSDD